MCLKLDAIIVGEGSIELLLQKDYCITCMHRCLRGGDTGEVFAVAQIPIDLDEAEAITASVVIQTGRLVLLQRLTDRETSKH